MQAPAAAHMGAATTRVCDALLTATARAHRPPGSFREPPWEPPCQEEREGASIFRRSVTGPAAPEGVSPARSHRAAHPCRLPAAVQVAGVHHGECLPAAVAAAFCTLPRATAGVAAAAAAPTVSAALVGALAVAWRTTLGITLYGLAALIGEAGHDVKVIVLTRVNDLHTGGFVWSACVQGEEMGGFGRCTRSPLWLRLRTGPRPPPSSSRPSRGAETRSCETKAH